MFFNMKITPEQCRAARALILWSQGRLAEAANVSTQTIRNFEAAKSNPSTNNMIAIQTALENAGVIFIDNGVTLSSE